MQFTQQHRENLRAYLKGREIPSGLGTKESACSVAAMNLAITGELTDKIPECMSEVLGTTVIILQDVMPNEMRNSEEYKTLLPDMAGTGREHEKERAGFLLDWMWETVFPQVQPIADKQGFGREWKTMCEERTYYAARAAAYAARAAAYAAEAAAYAAAGAAARAAALAAEAANAAAKATALAAEAARAAAYAARAAAYAAYAAARAAQASNDDNFWQTVDPISLLKRMTYLEKERESK